MRILLAGPLDAGDAVHREVDRYRAAGHDVVVNDFYLHQERTAKVGGRYQGDAQVTFRTFDPSDAKSLRAEITGGNIGYDAVVYPPDLEGFTHEVVAAAADASLAHPIRVVGCPNDVIRHLSAVEEHGIPVEKSSDIHAGAVAEYTLSQMGFHARKIGQFYDATGKRGAWPHDQAGSTTTSLAGKTLGVIGVMGKDGSAVAMLAKKMGLRVVGIDGPGRAAGIQELGVEAALNLEELLRQSDFISINSARNKTLGLIDSDQFDCMKSGVIIINPSGAEIIEKNALLNEFSKPPKERKVGAVILDMPYGGRRGNKTFSFDRDNAKLKSLGVLFTPRMAGYTIDTYTRGVEQVADAINKRLQHTSATTSAERLDGDVR
jgi:phosphoglycerate dehydrogenase-like enzyme